MKIWQLTKGGKELFPYDPIAEKVRNIRKYRIYSEEALQIAYEKEGERGLSIDETRKALEDKGCTFVKRLPFSYTVKELN